MESSCTGREPESLRENFVLSRMHCRMTGTQGLSVTGSNDLLSDGKWLLFLKRQAFSDWFRDAATCAPIEDKTLSKRIARSEENEVSIAIPSLEATCHSLNGWWSLTACSIFNWYDWLQCMANSNCKTRICNRYRLLY